MNERFDYVVLSFDAFKKDGVFSPALLEVTLQDYGMQSFRVVGVIPGDVDVSAPIIILSKIMERPLNRAYHSRTRFPDDRR